MGFDTSFHPVDVALVRDRLLPYIAGDGADDDLDDLVRRAVALRRVRFRAKAWALGAYKAAEKLGVEGLASDVHVWGRPFFIVADGPDQVAEAVMRYVATPLDQVDALAREMAGRVDARLADALELDDSGHLPGDEELGRALIWRFGLLRSSARALRAGERTVRDRDQEHDAAQLLSREVPFSVVEFASALTPGWMSRGYTWPTALYSAADVPATGFTAAEPLFGALRDGFPRIDWFSESTITENYMVGGFVAAADVPGARAALTANRAALLEPPSRDDWDDYALVNLVKIDEALALAARLGYGFCEATEIYSGFEGNLN